MKNVKALTAEKLYRRCDPKQFDFDTTSSVAALEDVIGQSRAVEAIRFGIGIGQEGYNLFAIGPVGTGKRSLVREFFERQATKQPAPPDWCYVNNFEKPHKPRALRLPPGKGKELRRDMEELVEELRTALPTAFESEEYQTRRQVLQEETQEKQQEALETLQEKAQKRDVALMRTPVGVVFAPLRDGDVLSPEELEKLPEKEQNRLQAKIEELQDELQKILQRAPRWQRELREKLKELNREITNFAVGGLINELEEKFADLPEVVDYLDAVQQDVIDNAKDFLPQNEQQKTLSQVLTGQNGAHRTDGGAPALRRYRVNVLVDHSDSAGAPVVYEDNPTYQNLVGRVVVLPSSSLDLSDKALQSLVEKMDCPLLWVR